MRVALMRGTWAQPEAVWLRPATRVRSAGPAGG
jgi:hypothetical protein